jgi:DNA replication protein DnaC
MGGENGSPLTEEEIARRTALYFQKKDGYYCPECQNTRSVSEKVWMEPDPMYGNSRFNVGHYENFHVGPCPDCGGESDPETVFVRRLRTAGIHHTWVTRFSFETYDTSRQPTMAPVFRQVQAWAARPAGTLVLAGPRGTGKTHLAIAASIEIIRNGLHCRFAEVETMLRSLRTAVGEGNYPEVYDGWLDRPNVLVLDEFGGEHKTEFGVDAAENLIAWRLLRERPMLITTNVGSRDMGERLASRFRDQSQVTLLMCQGSDMRPTNEPRGEKDDTIIEVKETGL